MRPTPLAVVLAMLLPTTLVRAEATEIDFNRDIRPILSENCFHCHGPDAKAREADLRLDTFEGATTGGEFADPIVPGKPDESEVIARVFSDDPDELMPPPESNRSLTAEQKELLRKWIASGAKYEDHWAWVTPKRPAAPKVKHADRVANPIDAFLLRRLEAEGMSYADPAPPTTILRRLSLDLVGLPPSPEEIVAFEQGWETDPAKTLEQAVDRLLASPRFGERWARHWLDLARYADSNGFQADQLRPSWAYRDWVIDALNANMPYDQFTIEQLAGDLLPDPTVAQKVATGFHRTVTCNVEAGVHPEENRYNQVVDRVNTTGTTWLGVTMECAQCHDHKYDPFSMKDYYSLFAFFNNTPLEVSLPSGKTDVSHDFIGPYLELPLSKEDQAKADALDKEIKTVSSKREALLADPETGFGAWEAEALKQLAKGPRWTPLATTSFQSNGGEDHKVLEDQSILLTGNVPGTATYTVTGTFPLEQVTGFKIEALTHPELPGKGPGRGDAKASNFVLHEFEASVRQGGKDVPLELFGAEADFSQSKWDVAGLIDGKPKTGWAIAPQFGKPHWATVQLSKPVTIADGTSFTFTLDQNWGRGRVIGCLRISAITDPAGIGTLPEAIAKALKKPAAKRSRKERDALQKHYLASAPEIRKLDSELQRLRKQRGAIKPVETLVMVEMDEPRQTFITHRGIYTDLGDEVQPATPETLPPPSGKPGNRLDLARWLVQRDNPLTARVAVNRWWAELFGNGIVGTLEDFGTQADPPTHPELLDWLAVEFMESGWDLKHILKTMVLTHAYQQSSTLTAEHLDKDPRNFLFARAPRFRMDAERIRDNALAISGLLSTKMHGPPVMPYQPPGLWRQTGRNEPKWQENKNEDRWRRGVYIVYRRAAPYPSMVNFDAPDRAACTVKRPRTNTPLQALTLLNDPAYLEMALALADEVLTGETETAARLDLAFLRTLSRHPKPEEAEVLGKLLKERLAHFQADPKAAKQLLGNPTFFYQPTHPNPAELAAWFHLTTILLNLDETVTRS